MIINDPVLAPDVSLWVVKLNAREFEDGGCGSIVVGLYPQMVNGVRQLHPACRQQVLDVMTNTHLVLQVYLWDDIILSPTMQADWLISTIRAEGIDARFIWIDQEQWWTDWGAWHRHDPVIPRMAPDAISSHNWSCVNRVKAQFPGTGVYTNQNFVVSNSPQMNTWLGQHHSWIPHYGRQPGGHTLMSWDELKEHWMPTYDPIRSAGQPAEMMMGHQFTGDRCMLPGSYNQYGKCNDLDVSIFRRSFIDSIRNGSAPVPVPVPPPAPVPPPVTYKICKVLYTRINIRAKASQMSAWVRFAVLNEILQVLTGVVVNGYIELTDHTWVYAAYVSVPK
jgi:hypothetical protein